MSSALNDAATIPGSVLMVKKTSLIGPRISSTLPICDLFSRLISAQYVQNRRIEVRDMLGIRTCTKHLALHGVHKLAKGDHIRRWAGIRKAATAAARAKTAAATTTSSVHGHRNETQCRRPRKKEKARDQLRWFADGRTWAARSWRSVSPSVMYSSSTSGLSSVDWLIVLIGAPLITGLAARRTFFHRDLDTFAI